MKHTQIKNPNQKHSHLLSTFSELTLEQTALLLDCILYATVDTKYIDGNDTLNELKDALSATLALGVIYQEAR